MKINRNNYEEFFLLYIDHELSAADRQAVEDFAEKNADLRNELEALQQTTFRPDRKVSFGNKESLMQFTAGEECINAVNYEQYFVQYLDNELDHSQKAAVEEFVYRHPQFQEEFELLQEIRLTPDPAVVYEDKKSLYRFESQKPVAIPWWRLSAAAVILVLAGILWMKLQPESTPVREVAEVNAGKPSEDSTKVQEPVVKRGKVPESLPVVPGIGKHEEEALPQIVKQLHPRETKARNDKPAQSISQVEQEVAAAGQSKSPQTVDINAEVSNQLPVNTGLASEEITPAKAGVTLTGQSLAAETVNNATAAHLALMEMPDDENTFLTNIPISRKSTVSRIFRKASRVIQKTTDLANARKAGIQIGNIEIAFQ